MKRYYFEDINACEMCGDSSGEHLVIGRRLNSSQGFSPGKKTGITVSIQKCKRCGLIYSNPQPIPFDIQDHYGIPPDSYWTPDYFKIEESYFSLEIQEIKSQLNFLNGMKALDIGAGLGKCMIALEKAGFDTYGLEPSKPFYEKAISNMGISRDKLKLGSIEEVEYPESSFDLITFGAVFEHLYHPFSILQKTLKWLKPNGIIHIEVPSSKWLMSKLINFYYKITGKNYVTNLSPMHVPFHLYEFDLRSFQLAGERLSLSVVGSRIEVCTIYGVPGFLQPFLKLIMEKTNTGMQLIVYLKKN